MTRHITAAEIIKTVVFDNMKKDEQAVIYQAANCDRIGAAYDEKMTGAEIAEFTRIRKLFFPIRKTGRMFPRFADNGEPTDTTSHDWSIKESVEVAEDNDPIKDGELSHLFTVLEIYELKTWANGYIKAVDTYVELKNYVEDDWVEYMLPSGEIADIRISRIDDEHSPDYNKIEAFAYRTMLNEKDDRVSDTSVCVRLL